MKSRVITLIENFRAVFYAPFYAAVALGAYRQEGLEVVIKTSTDPASTVHFLLSGQGEVSWGGPLRLMFTLEKNPVSQAVAFCEVVGRDPFFLVGRVRNPTFRLEDLTGKRVATVSEVPTPWMCLQHDLRRAGIDPSKIDRTPDGTMAGNAAALRAGQVDVIQVFEPFAAQLEAEAAGHIWYAAASRGPTSYTTLNTTRGFLEENPDVALRMCRALYRTQKWIAARDGRDLAKVVGSYFPDLSGAVLASSFDGYRARGVWNRTPLLQPEGFEWLRDAALAGGLLRTRFSYDECVDMRFAERAVRDDPPSI